MSRVHGSKNKYSRQVLQPTFEFSNTPVPAFDWELNLFQIHLEMFL